MDALFFLPYHVAFDVRNQDIGGADHAEYLPAMSGLGHRSRKWWDRPFWATLEVICQYLCHLQPPVSKECLGGSLEDRLRKGSLTKQSCQLQTENPDA
jgi:hypothetical protein